MKKSIIILLIALFPAILTAQNVKFTAKAPSQVGVGQRFEIDYTVKAGEYAKNFTPPKVGSNLKIISTTKSTGVSTSISIINGNVKREETYTTTWSVIVEALKTGTVTLQPASAKVSGKVYKSNSVTIKITKDKPQQQRSSNPLSSFFNDPFFNPPQQQRQQASPPANNDIFMRLSANKSTVYVGEPVYAYCQLYVSQRFQLQLQEFNPPTFDKFWTKEVEMPKNITLKPVLYNNHQYLSAVMDKRLLFPQSSGKLEIEPYDASFSLYDSWGFPIGDKKIFSNRQYINVKPLPANKPANFSGAVGSFQISSSIDNQKPAVNDAITITVTVSGSGNFGLFDFPQPDMPKVFEELSPEESENLTVTTTGISGNKTTKFAYIARVPGDYKIPPVEFSYFDPSKGKYFTVKTDTIEIHVSGDSASVNNAYLKPSQYNEIADDIRFIKSNTKLHPVNSFIFKSDTALCLTYLGLILLFALIMLLLRKKIKENANITLVKYKNANKISRKRLKKAREFMQQNKKDEFYQEIINALWGYVSDKLNIDRSKLTRDNVSETFDQNGVSEELKKEFINLIDRVEMSRYAPVEAGENTEELYNKASALISNFEKDFEKNKTKAK